MENKCKYKSGISIIKDTSNNFWHDVKDIVLLICKLNCKENRKRCETLSRKEKDWRHNFFSKNVFLSSKTSKSNRFSKCIGFVRYKSLNSWKRAKQCEYKSFLGWKKITQNVFWNYKINLHFLEFSLAINCDENNHKYRNK